MKAPLFLFLFLLFLFPLVSAVPPITTEFVGDTGLAIETSIMDYYKINDGACIQIFVFNRTNGEILEYPAVSCEVFLSNRNGTELLNGYPTAHLNHFEMCRTPDIVTEIGTYSVTMVCNSSTVGGFNTHYFEATETGKPKGIVILIILFGFGLTLLLLGILLHNPWLGFVSSIMMLLSGMYALIYGLNQVQNFYTQGVGITLIGFAFVIMFSSAYEWWGSGGSD